MFAMHACSDACVVLFGLVQSVSFALVIYKKLEIKKKKKKKKTSKIKAYRRIGV